MAGDVAVGVTEAVVETGAARELRATPSPGRPEPDWHGGAAGQARIGAQRPSGLNPAIRLGAMAARNLTSRKS